MIYGCISDRLCEVFWTNPLKPLKTEEKKLEKKFEERICHYFKLCFENIKRKKARKKHISQKCVHQISSYIFKVVAILHDRER